jgi:hypothetical protein
VVLRLVSGILALTFLPIGLVFLVIGLTVEDADRGEPEAFLYLGPALALVGVVFALTFAVLQRREIASRRRRREGLRATVEIVRAQFNPNVRSGSSMSLRLTVRFPSAGTADGTVSRTLMAKPTNDLTEGARIEILYDPADPANFEPLPQGTA